MLIRCYIYANADTINKTKDKFDQVNAHKFDVCSKLLCDDYIAGEGAI